MLRNAKDLKGYTIHAIDGDIGHVDEFYFDDDQWAVRYLVANTGSWLSGRLVLIANASIHETKWEERQVVVDLTREQVENAPGAETDRPVTRRYEGVFADYYGYPYYWAGVGMDMSPGLIAMPEIPATPPESPVGDSHLQSTSDVAGFHIAAEDGEIGHVVDLVIDDENWTIRYLEVDTRNWWPGKKVLVAPSWIEHMDWQDGKVQVKLTRDTIQNAPEYDPLVAITRQYEIDLFDYYGQHRETQGDTRYWEG